MNIKHNLDNWRFCISPKVDGDDCPCLHFEGGLYDILEYDYYCSKEYKINQKNFKRPLKCIKDNGK